MSTFYPRPGDLQEKWFVVDAKGEVLGRLASRIASVLRGKTLAGFHPAVNPNMHVIVLNADKVVLTGRKMATKKYYRHSGYPGGFREEAVADVMAKKPTEVLQRAVKGMLPKTRLGDVLLGNLKIYAGEAHPHQAQLPETITLNKRSSAPQEN
ncbi:50S ribosomal protein L13 [candidate division BRC1 bacterium HGW-BRC1-1]|jgi:large subunit ribosomal protein L13|nr:MAG: 50S ribosomal protein L13 [candidate division BRC1 bacterium HGW-BRC1-1]